VAKVPQTWNCLAVNHKAYQKRGGRMERAGRSSAQSHEGEIPRLSQR